MFARLSVTMLCVFCFHAVSEARTVGLCRFDTAGLTFRGDAAEQAKCLLRFVKPKASGSVEQPVPPAISTRIGAPIAITPDKLKACLSARGIAPLDVGGPIDSSDVTRKQRYFVIHDTSSPEINAPATFPDNINDASYAGNRIDRGWGSMQGRVNVLVSRTGQSRTMTDFGVRRTRPAVKLEMTSQVSAARPLFVHVENIQPRIKPAGSWAHKAPDPGFSHAQLQRLSVIYVVASVRAGRWLIPAFHFNVDSDLYAGVDVHDDPQAFDLAAWGDAVGAFAESCEQ